MRYSEKGSDLLVACKPLLEGRWFTVYTLYDTVFLHGAAHFLAG